MYDPETQRVLPAHIVMGKRAMEKPDRRSRVASPLVIGDSLPGGIDGIKSMADGQQYTSRRSYERSVARAGCEVVGHDSNWTEYVAKAARHDAKAHEADVVADVKKSIEQANAL